MPHDIFVSYSRKDSVQALELADRLRASGVSVWIDRRGIEGAERWAAEIVEGIRECSTFLVLLSAESIKSENVLRELSLASEKRKRILPVNIERTELPPAFQYAITGLQRVAISDFEAILRAHHHGVERTIARDSRKSLMILPLEDLSPAGEDNEWFADGLTSELISALSHIKSLRIPDRKTSMELKGFRGRTSEIARDLDIRYFIEGNVRKFGPQIKISVELLDVESGDHLWQHSYRGEFKDIFDMQEAVAREVVLGLKLHLTPEEQQNLNARGTTSTEAYEFFVRAREYGNRQTKEDIQFSLQLASDAIAADPNYADAYAFKAHGLASLYRAYEKRPELLAEAKSLALEALRLRPDLYSAYGALALIYTQLGEYAKAEEMAKEYTRKDPNNYYSHAALGFFYFNATREPSKAIESWKEAVALKPDYMAGLWNLAISCDAAHEREQCALASSSALPYYLRHLHLHPDDEIARGHCAQFLFWSGRKDEALEMARDLKDRAGDGMTLYNLACFFSFAGDRRQAIETCFKALDRGYSNFILLDQFLTDETNGVASVRGTPEYEALAGRVEQMKQHQIPARSDSRP